MYNWETTTQGQSILRVIDDHDASGLMLIQRTRKTIWILSMLEQSSRLNSSNQVQISSARYMWVDASIALRVYASKHPLRYFKDLLC